MARIILDTSVWIEFMRGNEPTCSTVSKMLDNDVIVCNGIILAELLQGAKSGKESKFIDNFPAVFEFPDETIDRWQRTGKLAAEIRSKGVKAPLSDCFIALTAFDSDALLLTLDKHFVDIERFIALKYQLLTA